MEILVYLGAAVTLAGLGGLVYCIVVVLKAKGAGLDDAALRARLQGITVLNMGALFLSALGLMMVVIGILL